MSEQIDQFFAPNGTLISIPVKAAKKVAVLKVIASKLSPDTKYPEKELNAIIATYHHDTAAIRRHMMWVDHALLLSLKLLLLSHNRIRNNLHTISP